MPHLTSASALRTAREIMKAYTLTVIPPEELRTGRLDGLTNSERHVATLIDHATNAHEVAKLRPEFHYWQRHLSSGVATAPQLAAFLSKVSRVLSEVPRRPADEQPVVSTFRTYPEAKAREARRELSKPSTEVARVLFYYYRIAPVGRAASPAYDMHAVATLVEVVLGLSRIMKVEGAFARMRAELQDGRVTEAEVSKFMRAMGILFDRLPSYENREEEVVLLA